MRILLIEDDENLNRQLAQMLRDSDYVVDCAYDGEEGHFLGDTEPYDAVILDIGLPQMDGVTVLDKWRQAGRNMPVLILTARDRWSDKVAGIDAGADDYVTKPFHIEEVMARIRALIRRAAGHAAATITCGPIELDVKASKATLRRRDTEADLARIPVAVVSDASPGGGGLADGADRTSLRSGFRSRFQYDRGFCWQTSEEDRG